MDNIQKTGRREEITQAYFQLLDRHLDDLLEGRAIEMMELREIAAELCVSHTHLTDMVRKQMGNHPCYFYDLKIIERAKKLLAETDKSVAEIARTLTYDPSNFSKFFKKFTGGTPGGYRRFFSST